MFTIILRTIISYVLVLIAIRMMGKSELAKLSPFQMVILIMLGQLASITIENPDISLISGFSAIFTLIFLQTLISTLSLNWEWFKNFVNGKPSIIIDDGKINAEELKQLRLNINDLAEQLRIKDIPSIADVAYAVMESNGSLSVIPKPEKSGVTLSDLNIKKEKTIMPVILICDGVLYSSNLTRLNWSEDYLKMLLKNYHIDSYQDIFLAFSDENKKLHVYPVTSKGDMSVEVIL